MLRGPFVVVGLGERCAVRCVVAVEVEVEVEANRRVADDVGTD